jgi:hypothetical protein
MSGWFRAMLQEWGARARPDDAPGDAQPSALDFLHAHVSKAGVRLNLLEPPAASEEQRAALAPSEDGEAERVGFGRRRARQGADEPPDRPIDFVSARAAMRDSRLRLARRSAPFDLSAIRVEAIASGGYGVTFVCQCKRAKSFPPAFFKGLPITQELAAIQQRLKCSRCGEKGAIATTIIAPLELLEACSDEAKSS